MQASKSKDIAQACIPPGEDLELWAQAVGAHVQAQAGVLSPLGCAAALSHQDGVLGLAAVELGERCLLSCSLDGTVKAWK